MGIKYLREYTLKHQIGNFKIRVDFVLKYKDKTVIIEYNGKQHYQPVEFFGGEEKFKKQQIRDEALR